MSTNKHTPGPWRAARTHLASSRQGWYIHAPGRDALAFVPLHPIAESQRANAHLIAAAQEVLSALEACERFFSDPRNVTLRACRVAGNPMEAARAAIAKATGQHATGEG